MFRRRGREIGESLKTEPVKVSGEAMSQESSAREKHKQKIEELRRDIAPVIELLDAFPDFGRHSVKGNVYNEDRVNRFMSETHEKLRKGEIAYDEIKDLYMRAAEVQKKMIDRAKKIQEYGPFSSPASRVREYEDKVKKLFGE